jgi:DNA repair photolyase
MPEFNEVKIKRILNPTSIGLGDYVINPFMGCEFSCLYCYVRSNRVVSRKNKPWGEYVDIRVNAADLLEKEIAAKKPKRVLLGSTTECFQPAEIKYGITAKVLEVLNKQKIYYVILTRSPYILNYISLLKQGFCKNIYFTINRFSAEFKQALEPKSPSLESRFEAVDSLLSEGLPVIPYFSPLLPWVSDITGVFLRCGSAESIEFEGLNFQLKNIRDIINSIACVKPSLKAKYDRMHSDRDFYARVWESAEKNIASQAKCAKKRYDIYIHRFGEYFKNTYPPS